MFAYILRMKTKICAVFGVFVMLRYAGGSPDSLKNNYKFPYYTRDDWNAAPATKIRALNIPVPHVVIYHTNIPGACYTFENCSRSMKAMQNYHKSKLHWGDIGYNFCVGSEGGAYEGRGWKTVGSHAGRINKLSVGICLIGDWRAKLPPPVQLLTTKALIASGVDQGYVSPEYKLIAHNQVIRFTECLGTALFNEISKWEHFSPNSFANKLP